MKQRLPKSIVKAVESLNEDQLHFLNHIIVQRLRLMQSARAMYAMKDFNFLDRVYFDNNGRRIEGVVTRLNQKTITVTTDDGGHWNVSPGLLTKIEDGIKLKEIS
jgi:hypothetical protein